MGRKLEVAYVDEPPKGDHICYISNPARFRGDYPESQITRSLDAIRREVAQAGQGGVRGD